MFFTAFGPNAYPMMPTYPNYEFFQNFQNPMTGFVTNVPQQFSDFCQWNQFFQT